MVTLETAVDPPASARRRRAARLLLARPTHYTLRTPLKRVLKMCSNVDNQSFMSSAEIYLVDFWPFWDLTSKRYSAEISRLKHKLILFSFVSTTNRSNGVCA